MTDSPIQQCIEWLDWYIQQYGSPQNDPSAVVRLIRATADYLQWMKSVNYSLATVNLHRRQLEMFLDFVKNRRIHWQRLFTDKTREHFKKISGLATTVAVNGLSRYLVKQGQLKTPLPQHPQQRKLTGTFEGYLQFRQDGHQTGTHQLVAIRRVLSALCDYLNAQDITLHQLRIEDLDAFMAEFCQPFSPGTCRTYRTIVRGFLTYLHQQCGILKDDIAFKKEQLRIEDRKNNQPLTLPIPEQTLKAIVAYMVGGRPNSKDRHLVLSFHAPYGPIVPGLVGRYIQEAMHKAGLSSTPYWLRHSYAQHLLSSGASIYEINAGTSSYRVQPQISSHPHRLDARGNLR